MSQSKRAPHRNHGGVTTLRSGTKKGHHPASLPASLPSHAKAELHRPERPSAQSKREARDAKERGSASRDHRQCEKHPDEKKTRHTEHKLGDTLGLERNQPAPSGRRKNSNRNSCCRAIRSNDSICKPVQKSNRRLCVFCSPRQQRKKVDRGRLPEKCM